MTETLIKVLGMLCLMELVNGERCHILYKVCRARRSPRLRVKLGWIAHGTGTESRKSRDRTGGHSIGDRGAKPRVGIGVSEARSAPKCRWVPVAESRWGNMSCAKGMGAKVGRGRSCGGGACRVAFDAEFRSEGSESLGLHQAMDTLLFVLVGRRRRAVSERSNTRRCPARVSKDKVFAW